MMKSKQKCNAAWLTTTEKIDGVTNIIVTFSEKGTIKSSSRLKQWKHHAASCDHSQWWQIEIMSPQYFHFYKLFQLWIQIARPRGTQFWSDFLIFQICSICFVITKPQWLLPWALFLFPTPPHSFRTLFPPAVGPISLSSFPWGNNRCYYKHCCRFFQRFLPEANAEVLERFWIDSNNLLKCIWFDIRTMQHLFYPRMHAIQAWIAVHTL